MLAAPILIDEEVRYQDLLTYDILDSENETTYNDLSNLIALVCDCPKAIISFFDKERQWFKAKTNFEGTSAPREYSICGHVISNNATMIIQDLSKDLRFFDNPLVMAADVKFYAGAPIISSEGNSLGTVCVMDSKPREIFTEANIKALEVVALQITQLLELRKRNKLIVEQTKQLIDYQKNNARLNIINYEKQNDRIAYELNENIAQILAVAKMKAEAIDTDAINTKDLMAQVKNYLAIVITEVKSLANSVSPTTYKSADYQFYIHRMIEKFTTENEIIVHFKMQENAKNLNSIIGLTVYRIFQHFLKYAKLIKATEISFVLEPNLNAYIEFTHNGDESLANLAKIKLIINNIYTRVDIIMGKFENNRADKKMIVVFKNDETYIQS